MGWFIIIDLTWLNLKELELNILFPNCRSVSIILEWGVHISPIWSLKYPDLMFWIDFWQFGLVLLLTILYVYCLPCLHLSYDMTKPTKWMCAQRRLRSAWASAQSDQSLRCALNGWLRTQGFFMQTAKTLHWEHTHFVGFVMSWLIYIFFLALLFGIQYSQWDFFFITGHHQVRVYDYKCSQRRPVLDMQFDEYPITAMSLVQSHNNQVNELMQQNNMINCAPIEDSDQPWASAGLIRICAVLMKKPCVLNSLVSAQWRLLIWVVAECTFHSVGFVVLWLS